MEDIHLLSTFQKHSAHLLMRLFVIEFRMPVDEVSQNLVRRTYECLERAISIGLAVGALGCALVFEILKWLHECVLEFGLGKEKRRRLPPGDFGLPIIGNMLDFLKAYKFLSDPDSFTDSLNKRYNRIGIYKGFMFGNPTAMLTIPETIKQVLMDDKKFRPGWPKSTGELIGKRSFIFIHDEEHKRLKKLTSSSINGFEALSTYLKYTENVVVEALDKWSKMDQIVFLTEMRRLTFRIIMHIFFSSENESLMDEMEKEYSYLNKGIRAMRINLPGFAYHRALKSRKKIVKVLKSILNERRMKYKNSSTKDKDLMGSLMSIEDENGRKLDDDEIIDIMVMYLNAGHESSAHTTMWATVFLQQNPEILKKAKEEQEEIQRNIPPTQKGLTLKDYRKMEYLSKVIDETHRVASLAFVSFRQAMKDVEINGYLVPKGWRIGMWYRAVHMDPEVYPNPKKFDPSRWDKTTPKLGTYLPFGGGSRLCPGIDLAKMEISIFLHYFLLNYKLIQLNPDCPLMYLPHLRPKDNCPAKIVKISEP